MRGSLILYLKGMRIVMFQLSGFYYMVLMHLKVNGKKREGRSLLLRSGHQALKRLAVRSYFLNNVSGVGV